MAIATDTPKGHYGRLILKSAILRFCSMGINIVGTFLLIPFMVFNLGDYWYGQWAIIGAAIVQYHILDFGLSQTIVRFIAKYRSENAVNDIVSVFSTSLFTFSVFACLSFSLVATLAFHIGVFITDPKAAAVLGPTILMAGATMCCAFPTYAIEASYSGAMRQDVLSLLQIGRTLLRFGLTYFFVSEGYSIMALAAISLGCDSLYRLALVVLLRRFVPEARFRRSGVSVAMLRKMLSFGRYVFLTNISRYSTIHSSMLVVGALLGAAPATAYAIAINIIERLEGLVRMALFMTMPAFASLGVSVQQSDFARERFLTVARTVALAVTLTCGGLIVAGEAFILNWMGPAYAHAYWPLAILAAAWLFDLSQAPAMQVLTAVAEHRRFAVYDFCAALCSLGLSVILAPHMGLSGVALGLAVPVAFSALVMKPRNACAALGVALGHYYKQIGSVIGGAAALQLPIWLLLAHSGPYTMTELAGFGLVTYGAAGMIAGLVLLPPADQRYIVSLIPARLSTPLRAVFPHLRPAS